MHYEIRHSYTGEILLNVDAPNALAALNAYSEEHGFAGYAPPAFASATAERDAERKVYEQLVGTLPVALDFDTWRREYSVEAFVRAGYPNVQEVEEGMGPIRAYHYQGTLGGTFTNYAVHAHPTAADPVAQEIAAMLAHWRQDGGASPSPSDYIYFAAENFTAVDLDDDERERLTVELDEVLMDGWALTSEIEIARWIVERFAEAGYAVEESEYVNGRTILVHLNVRVPASDNRADVEIRQAILGALRSRHGTGMTRGLRIEAPLVETIDGATSNV